MAVTLVVFKKDGSRKNVHLNAGVTVIGRHPECDLRIPLLHVSRRHCRILQEGDKSIVQDLGSSNGTFLNSARIVEAVLNAGDLLLVSTMAFTVQIDGQPEKVTPPPQLTPTLQPQLAGPGSEDLDTLGPADLPAEQDDMDDESSAPLEPLDEPNDELADLEPPADGDR